MIGRTLLAAILLGSFVSLPHAHSENTRDTALDKSSTAETAKTRDDFQRDFTPSYLAERLGIVQRSSKLTGVLVRDKSGHKLGKLQDVIVELSSGRVLCVLVSTGDSAAAVPVPGKSFRSADESGAVLDLDKTSLSDAPHSTSNPDLKTLFRALPESYRYFNQNMVGSENGNTTQSFKASDLIGHKVMNNTGESLGTVLNLMVDVPTARVIFAVISLAGSGTDLYTVPPAALGIASSPRTLLLKADKSMVAALAQSDGFFWSTLADANVGIATYHTFGQKPDFDRAGKVGADPTREEVRAKVEAAPAVKKADPEIEKDILMALMHDDVNNTLALNHAKIHSVNGQVMISGRVKNEKQRSKLVAIAGSVVSPANVHDQLEVK